MVLLLFHLHQYFSYFVAVSFIVGGNRRTRRKTPTCKPRHNIIDIAIEKVLLQYWTETHLFDFMLQLLFFSIEQKPIPNIHKKTRTINIKDKFRLINFLPHALCFFCLSLLNIKNLLNAGCILCKPLHMDDEQNIVRVFGKKFIYTVLV
jgi:hypothetical protein